MSERKLTPQQEATIKRLVSQWDRLSEPQKQKVQRVLDAYGRSLDEFKERPKPEETEENPLISMLKTIPERFSRGISEITEGTKGLASGEGPLPAITPEAAVVNRALGGLRLLGGATDVATAPLAPAVRAVSELSKLGIGLATNPEAVQEQAGRNFYAQPHDIGPVTNFAGEMIGESLPDILLGLGAKSLIGLGAKSLKPKSLIDNILAEVDNIADEIPEKKILELASEEKKVPLKQYLSQVDFARKQKEIFQSYTPDRLFREDPRFNILESLPARTREQIQPPLPVSRLRIENARQDQLKKNLDNALPKEVTEPLALKQWQDLSPKDKARARELMERAQFTPDETTAVLGKSFPTTEEDLKKLTKFLMEKEAAENTPTDMKLLSDSGSKWFLRKALVTVRAQLGKFGEPGKNMIRMLDEADRNASRRASAILEDIQTEVKHLSPEERAKIVDFLDKGTPLPANLSSTGAKLREVLDNIFREAESLGLHVVGPGGEKLPIRYMENYFPHIVKEDYLKSKFQLRRLIEHLKEKYDLSEDAAKAMAHEFVISQRMDPKKSMLEFARHLDLPEEFYERDLTKVLATYIDSAIRRFEEVRQFGAKDENLILAANSIRKIFGDSAGDYAMDVVRATRGNLGGVVVDPETSLKIRSFHAMTRLTLAPILNLSQGITGTALRTTVWDTLKAYYKVSTSEAAREAARRSGAVYEAAIKRMLGDISGPGSAGAWFMKHIGFNLSEKLNRYVAAIAGEEYLKSMAVKLAKNPENRYARRAITEFGLDPDKVVLDVQQQGIPRREFLDRAAQLVAEESQFKTRVQDLPLFASSPEGKVAYQFRQFAINQVSLLNKQILKPIKEALKTKNKYEIERATENVLKWIFLFPVSGFAFEEPRGWLRTAGNKALVALQETFARDTSPIPEIEISYPDPDTVEVLANLGFDDRKKYNIPVLGPHTQAELAARLLEDAAAAGAFAIFADAFIQAAHGDQFVTSLLGPSAATAVDLWRGISAAGKLAGDVTDVYPQENPENLEEALIRSAGRQIPLLNPFLVGPKPK